jgi:hypothetical protein
MNCRGWNRDALLLYFGTLGALRSGLDTLNRDLESTLMGSFALPQFHSL